MYRVPILCSMQLIFGGLSTVWGKKTLHGDMYGAVDVGKQGLTGNLASVRKIGWAVFEEGSTMGRRLKGPIGMVVPALKGVVSGPSQSQTSKDEERGLLCYGWANNSLVRG